MIKDKVSVIVATYNWKEALELSLGSLLNQTVPPGEIIIADDGSGDDTRKLIERLKATTEIPVIHLWQEDQGFRKTVILNKAMAQAQYDYLIQIDGDVIVERHFIQDHLEIAEHNCFVCGSRVKLGAAITAKILANRGLEISLFDMPISFMLNSFRSKILRQFVATKYGKKVDHLRGCNMAFWKKDIITVNGYNEDLLQWGHEDGELGFRLFFAGVRKKFLKMGGIVYHLNHKESSRSNEEYHLAELERTKKEHRKYCTNGINKYL
ncbi:glycosyltransferase family 2 protein [Bacteroides helcogenes]|uniref:Glycosyl transferase family 2 n=1 Tax=Bacteroides helcogenes (strain ATCC 35417 / DSM 20613 / JCM 6297 / CCUG 15421 / P 36-108) TaxID=693979 RepID=E6SW46_BACT6|nr:glycosyltransferase family 2 protein [Bacteroides helcogenes]ADV42571.1 glycosyl transferase family 2 [Bacteroides helcogenes P 36-108]MDY5237668.1 glycosyltransferase family 2 protein [Bacteroides helcogenes]